MVTLSSQKPHRPSGCALVVLSVVVVATQFAIGGPVREDVIDDAQERVGERHHGLLGATVPQDTLEAGPESTVLGSTRTCRGFDQGRPQLPVAFPGPARFVLSRALVVPRTERRPAREMAALGNARLSPPTSARMTSAVREQHEGLSEVKGRSRFVRAQSPGHSRDPRPPGPGRLYVCVS